jgi:hypothetical protein
MFKLLEKLKRPTTNHQYPLMRDPLRNPKCYEMTDAERFAAIARSDELLKQRVEHHVPGYNGA